MQMFLLITQCYAIIAGDFKKCDETFCGHFRTADYSQNKFNLDSYVFLNNILKGSIKREDNVLDFELSFTKDAIKFITKTSENQYKFEDETTPIPLETTYKSFNDHLSLKLDNKELLVTKYPFQFQLQVDKKPQFYFNRNNNLMLKNDTDSYSFDLEFASKNIYGIPERATDFSLKDTTASEPYRLMNLDVFEYETNSPQALYGSIPFLLSHTSTYSQGVYLKNPSEIWVDVIKSDQTLTHWMVDSGNLELYIYTGPTQENVFVQHTSISGKPFLPQYFAIAYHQCRWNYNTQQDVEQVDANFDKVNFPYDVLWLDIEHTDQKKYFTFNHEKFPEPLKMIEHLSAKGRKMVTIVDPHIKNDQGFEVSANLRKLGFLMKDKDGQVYNGKFFI
jgi:alpha-glucosidase (family GH31 glycosyl hydrolase)